MSEERFVIGPQSLPLWPGDLPVKVGKSSAYIRVDFPDAEPVNQALRAYLFARAEEPETAKQYGQSLGGTKVYDVAGWPETAAQLIDARAKQFYRLALKSETAFVDLSWANLYRAGDYLVPHSHIRAQASVVYCVDPGEEESGDPLAGQFCFVDPRLEVCCPLEPGRMTNPLRPGFQAGSMILFRSDLVHAVNPYPGERPRITLSWNLNSKPLSGDMRAAAERQAEGKVPKP